jgi:phosphate transport system protein
MSWHLQKEIEKLKKKLLTLSTYVEENVQRAVKSVEERNAKSAACVIEKDVVIDQMEIDVEEECLKILALHQPVAVDLRFLVAVLKINNDLERIGDLAVNIAERVEFLVKQPKVDIPFDFEGMSKKVQHMLTLSLDAVVNVDPALARQVLKMDDLVDEINRQMYDQVYDGIRRDPESTKCLMQLLSVSRQLERIADHATNIAEDVIYMIEGEIMRHRMHVQKNEVCAPTPAGDN